MNVSDREEIQSIEPKEMEEEKDVMEIIEEQINQTVLEEKTEEEVNHTETEISPQAITSSIFSPSSPKQTISQPQLSITTPPRASLKRQIICNDSPIISPSKIISISQPTFVTPVKKQIHNTKSVEVSPTKVQTDIEVIEENNTIILSSKVKKLLKEQEEERNQFRRLMKRQITAIQNNFEFGLSHWNNV